MKLYTWAIRYNDEDTYVHDELVDSVSKAYLNAFDFYVGGNEESNDYDPDEWGDPGNPSPERQENEPFDDFAERVVHYIKESEGAVVNIKEFIYDN